MAVGARSCRTVRSRKPSVVEVAPVHAEVVWQVWQVVGKPAAAWFGFVVELYIAL